MEDKPDVVHFQMDQPKSRQSEVTKALQIKLSNEKPVIVYNRVNSYILDALLKAVFLMLLPVQVDGSVYTFRKQKVGSCILLG